MTKSRRSSVAMVVLGSALTVASLAAEEGGAGAWTAVMAHLHEGDEPVPTAAAEVAPRVEVEAKRVSYGSATGYLARPKGASGELPGLIVIHEWWGLNANIEAMTRRLAGEGYTALAVDLYGGEVATDRPGAMRLMGAAMRDSEKARHNLREAFAYLREAGQAPRVGVIGWCFGGGWSLSTAMLLGEDLSAAVIYYGRLVTDPEELESVEAPILGLFGSEDRGIPVSSVEAFEATLKELKKDVEVRVYDGADHAFANPSGTRYDAEAAADAWGRTVAFLKLHLRGD